jgi:hypothetical protein
VPRPDEDRDENLTDESTVARDEYPHAELTPMNDRRALMAGPASHTPNAWTAHPCALLRYQTTVAR